MSGQVVQRRRESAVDERGRVQAVRQLAQLPDGVARGRRPGGQGRPHPLRVAVDLGGLQLEGQCEQRLLRAVVEVALDPPAFGPLGVGEPAPRGVDLLQPTRELGPEPGVVQVRGGQARRPPHGGDVVDLGVEGDPGDHPAVAVHVDLAARGPGGRAVRPHPPGVGSRVGDHQARILQRVPEHRLDVHPGVLRGERGPDDPPGLVGAPVEPAVDQVLEPAPQREGQAGRRQRADGGGELRRRGPGGHGARAEPDHEGVRRDEGRRQQHPGDRRGDDPLHVVQPEAEHREPCRDRDEGHEPRGPQEGGQVVVGHRAGEGQGDEQGRGDDHHHQPEQLAPLVAARAPETDHQGRRARDDPDPHDQHEDEPQGVDGRRQRGNGERADDVVEGLLQRSRGDRRQQGEKHRGADHGPRREPPAWGQEPAVRRQVQDQGREDEPRHPLAVGQQGRQVRAGLRSRRCEVGVGRVAVDRPGRHQRDAERQEEPAHGMARLGHRDHAADHDRGEQPDEQHPEAVGEPGGGRGAGGAREVVPPEAGRSLGDHDRDEHRHAHGGSTRGHGTMLAVERGFGVGADPDGSSRACSDAGESVPGGAWSHDHHHSSDPPRHGRSCGPTPPHAGGPRRHDPRGVRRDPRHQRRQRVRLVAAHITDSYGYSESTLQVTSFGAMAMCALLVFLGVAIRVALRSRRPAWTADVAMLGFVVIGLTISGWAVSSWPCGTPWTRARTSRSER